MKLLEGKDTLSEFYDIEEQEDANFFHFYHERNLLLVLPLPYPTHQAFYVSFFAVLMCCPTCAAMAMAVKSSAELISISEP